jgi:hypothetical protein
LSYMDDQTGPCKVFTKEINIFIFQQEYLRIKLIVKRVNVNAPSIHMVIIVKNWHSILYGTQL